MSPVALAATSVLALAGDGTDTYDMKLDLDGRLTGKRFSGTAKVEGRAFDEDGETGTCDEEYDWSAGRAPQSGLGVIRADIELPGVQTTGEMLLTTSIHSVYAAIGEPARIWRIDPESDEVSWSVDVDGRIDTIAADTSTLWALDATAGVVHSIDLAGAGILSTIDIGPREAEPQYPHPDAIVTVRNKAWVVSGDGRQLFEIDPTLGMVTRAIDLGGSLDALASNAPMLFANVVQLEPGVEGTGDRSSCSRPSRATR